MFSHIFIYRLKRCLRNKDSLIWTLLFPIVLGTLFFVAFGHLSTYSFKTFSIAAVDQYEGASYFDEVLISCSTGEDALFSVQYVSLEEAETLLEEGTVCGYYIITDQLEAPALVIGGDHAIEHSIMQSVLKQYIQIKEIITASVEAALRPEHILSALFSNGASIEETVEEALSAFGETDTVSNLFFSKEEPNAYQSYFYALIAMSCLFACYAGLTSANELLANSSSVGARCCLSPSHRMITILGDFFATLLCQFLLLCFVLIYLMGFLGIHFGDNIALITLTCFCGTLCGTASGYVIGSIPKLSYGTKNGILTAVHLSLCFFSGLMVVQMKGIVEAACPLFNRINPAAVITDCFYSLNIFGSYTRFFRDIFILVAISAILCTISYLTTRRVRYDNI